MSAATNGSSVPLYCSEQIVIPPSLPDVLKQFTKAAIREQPSDVVGWAAKYFGELANGVTPSPASAAAPVTRNQDQAKDVTKAHLLALKSACASRSPAVARNELYEICNQIELPSLAVKDAVGLGGFGDEVPWVRFFALLCAAVAPGLAETTALAAELLSANGDGLVPVTQLKDVYSFLAEVDGDVAPEALSGALESLDKAGAENDGLAGVSSLTA